MNKTFYAAVVLLFVLGFSTSVSAFLLNGSATAAGCSSSTYSACYDELNNNQWANGNVTRNVSNNLVVPWYSTSSGCAVSDLHSGGNCNIGTVNNSQYCMVSDEHSVVVRNVALGNNQTRMDLAYNSIIAMKGSFGQLPGWRCLVNQSTNYINCTDSRVNSNGDSASDATARYVYALFVAANNTNFNSTARSNYYALGVNLTRDMYQYETVRTCYNSTQGYGQVCVFAGGGANVVSSGMTATDFMYTGYFGDIIIAYLAACKATGNQTYCAAARNISIQYLDAANWTTLSFTAPPGKSFKYTMSATKPIATCTNTCSPDQWDTVDAPRAFSLGLAQYYANEASLVTMPGMQLYLDQWYARHLGTVGNAVIQYYPNGTGSSSSKSDYFSVGLMAYLAGSSSTSNFKAQLDNALGHYSSTPKTWDYTACFGVYGQQSPMYALAAGIGRDNGLFQFSVDPLTANVSVTIYDADTGTLLTTANVTATLASGTGSTAITTQNATATFINQTAGSYTLTLNASGYDNSQYTFTLTGGANQALAAYLTPTDVGGNYTVIFNILDYETANTVSEATINQYRDVNGTLTLVQVKSSDVSGRVQISYQSDVRYSFVVSKAGYESLTFYLDPILFTSYNVKIRQSTQVNSSSDLYAAEFYTNTTVFTSGVVVPMTVGVTSASGLLTSYNISVVGPCNSVAYIGINSYGQNYQPELNLTCTNGGQVVLSYCYDTTIDTPRCLSQVYLINPTRTNTTFISNTDNTYGLGVLDRVIIAVVIVLLVVGITAFIGGIIASSVLGAILMGFFVYIGFIPIWSVVVSMLIFVVLLSRRMAE